jgi:hypothetical protein
VNYHDKQASGTLAHAALRFQRASFNDPDQTFSIPFLFLKKKKKIINSSLFILSMPIYANYISRYQFPKDDDDFTEK